MRSQHQPESGPEQEVVGRGEIIVLKAALVCFLLILGVGLLSWIATLWSR